MLKQDMYILEFPFLLCISIGFLLHSLVVGQIPLGSKVSVVDNNFWVSSNGDFALGFFNTSDQPNQYSVGIRFNSDSIPVSKREVVWVVGADVTVANKSYFQLNQYGELVLFDSFKGQNVWTSQTSMLSVVSADLRDDGNLILLNRKKDVVWQSFNTPSDTLLPGQTLSVLQILRAASSNSMSSYFSLYVNASGQLQLRWESHVTYWTSGSPISSNITASLTSSGALQVRDQRLKPVWSAFGEDHGDVVQYRFLRLDVDGNLRLYSWVEASQAWKSVWQAVENQCNVFATCGEGGICVLTAAGSSDCICPFKVTTDSNSKCVVPYREDCKSISNMVRHNHTNLYGLYPKGYSVIQPSLHQCESLCLNDPDCTVATFANNGTAQCWLEKTRYVTGYSDPSLSSVSFVKTCSDPRAVNPNLMVTSPAQSSPIRSYEFCIPCLIGVASGTLVVFILIQLGVVFCIYRRTSSRKKAALAYTHNSRGLIVLSFSEIKDLTENFKHQMGPEMFKGCREFVSHGNLKCENVLLDENFEAKVTEFGLWRVNAEASGCGFSAERDVMEFGNMVLRLISGCRDVRDLCEWAYKEWMEGRAENVVDKAIDGGINLQDLERALRIAFWCLQNNERMRPSMGEVVKVLEGTLTVDPPPPPFSCQRPLEIEEVVDVEICFQGIFVSKSKAL
ncbi:g-type lectin s-receptor-like serine/threonine-protein kinase sd3-1 [Quercus suber]|uniref:non-specific serine/threonine protein kinase n=1 Tax=Quercus suber TaxID=58331 RepID=A0AAW0KH64_QUESU